MLIAGLTGGLACGKTFVADAFKKLGCQVVEADQLGHEVMLPAGPAYDSIVSQFGPAILNSDRTINRSTLASIVFFNPDALAKLNAIVHPAVQTLAQECFRQIAERDPDAIGIYVAAILIESGGYREFPKLIVVTCTPQQQLARALARPGAREKDVLSRLHNQLPLEQKREFADYVIDTGGTVEDTLRQTKIVFGELKKLACDLAHS